MSKMRNDLHRCVQNPEEDDETLTRLDPRFFCFVLSLLITFLILELPKVLQRQCVMFEHGFILQVNLIYIHL